MYQERLWKHLNEEHGLSLLESELREIVNIVHNDRPKLITASYRELLLDYTEGRISMSRMIEIINTGAYDEHREWKKTLKTEQQ